MMLATNAAAAALHAELRCPESLPAGLTIGTDTRRVAPGSTFLALRGERFDGHAFVADAFARGAAACIVDDSAAIPPGRPALIVSDTLRAYLQLAALARADVHGTVIAISGSTGKTTTKAYLLGLLAAAGVPVTATPENENNEIGVARFLLGLDAGDARIAIVEMGARQFGDIDVLVAAARPDVALLTNIGDAHLEIMGSRERLAHTKWGLFRGGARAVLNVADAESRVRGATLEEPAVWFGIGAETPPPGASAVIVRDARTLAVFAAGAVREIALDVRGRTRAARETLPNDSLRRR
jgi:UDP-N-acetylmuramoyl-tripeptide--D-alanyl-D-alanine ligase